MKKIRYFFFRTGVAEVVIVIMSSVVGVCVLFAGNFFLKQKKEKVDIVASSIDKFVVESRLIDTLKTIVNITMIPLIVERKAVLLDWRLEEEEKEQIIVNQDKKLREKIMSYRFGNGGYLFIVDRNLDMKVHPTMPELENKNQQDLKSVDGVYIFQEIKKKCAESKNQEAIVFYKWPKKGSDAPVNKITYAKIFPEFEGYYVCSSEYLDDGDKPIDKQQDELGNKTVLAEEIKIKRTFFDVAMLGMFYVFETFCSSGRLEKGKII